MMDADDRKKLALVAETVVSLKDSLYGQSPSDLGDIGEIKEQLKETRKLKSRVVRIETILKVCAGVVGGGGLIGGIPAVVLKAFGVW